MRGHRVVFVEPLRAELQPFEVNESLADHELLIQTEYSVISAGTEGSHYSGLENEMPGRGPVPYPVGTGYGNLGRVITAGSARADMVGRRVLTYANHASHVRANANHFALPVPEDADGKRVVFTRMVGVAMTSVRSASVSVGDSVLVVGMGLVGNFAAQLFQIAGADVLAVDVADDRLRRARECGIGRTCNPAREPLPDVVRDWTGGKGAQISVEAIGNAELIAQCVELTRRKGEVILLGSPRKRVTMDVTPMLTRVHLQGIRIVGALEWLYPVQEHDASRHSIIENYRQIIRWILAGRVAVDPLRTHVLAPDRCQEAYMGLHAHKDAYLGVVFDWSVGAKHSSRGNTPLR
jgi:2-desacetyl-2-hydroxyethyl bacteriochlorophyllide A dehydrogenase